MPKISSDGIAGRSNSPSGAVLYAALRVASQLEQGEIACLFADSGWKYLSLGIWEAPLEDAQATVRDSTWW